MLFVPGLKSPFVLFHGLLYVASFSLRSVDRALHRQVHEWILVPDKSGEFPAVLRRRSR